MSVLSFLVVLFCLLSVPQLSYGAVLGALYEQPVPQPGSSAPSLSVQGATSITDAQQLRLTAIVGSCSGCSLSYRWKSSQGVLLRQGSKDTVVWMLGRTVSASEKHYVSVTLQDGKGHDVTVFHKFTVTPSGGASGGATSSLDVISPSIQIFQPSSLTGVPSVAEGSSVMVKYRATDNKRVTKTSVFLSTNLVSLTPVANCSNLSAFASCNIAIPAGNTNKYIVVKAFDAAGNVRRMNIPFKTVAAGASTCSVAPAAPYLYDPGLWGTKNTFTIQWRAASGAESYILWESPTTTFTTPTATKHIIAGGKTTSFTLSGKANGKYYYQLQAVNSCGVSGRSTWVDFEVRVNNPPNIPNTPVPANGKTGVSTSLHGLSWYGGDPNGGNTDYYVQFGTDPNNLGTIQAYLSKNAYNSSVTLPSYLNPLKPGTAYYWRVRARDNHNVVTEGPVWSFKTNYASPNLNILSLNLTGTYAKGNTLTAAVTVRNDGVMASKGGYIDFFNATTATGEDIPFRTVRVVIPALQPAKSVNLTAQLPIDRVLGGTNYIVAKITTDDFDSNFANNVKSVSQTYGDLAPKVDYADFRYTLGNNRFATGQKATFVYSVSDDIGVAGVNLFYSTNNGTSWTQVGTNVPITNGGFGNAFDWTIPANTPLNSTFKVKVVAKDSSGQLSSPSVLGPFTIIDGTTPTVTFITPAGGETFKLGTPLQIKWSATAASGITSVSFSYRMTNNPSWSQYIGEDTTGNSSGTITWNIPANGFYASSSAYINMTVWHNTSTPLIVKSNTFSVVADTSQTPPAPWSAPAKITSNQGVGYSSMVADSQGNTHFAYVGAGNIYYMKKSNGVWSSPVAAYTYSEPNPALRQGIWDLKLTVGSNNLPHIVWQTGSRSTSYPDCTGQNYQEIYSSSFNGTSWSTPVNVSSNSTISFSPSVAIDGSGNTHIVWSDGQSYSSTTVCNSSPSVRKLYHRIKYANGTWSSASVLTGTDWVFSPMLKSDLNGVVHLVYANDRSGVWHRVWTGSAWGTPEIARQSVDASYAFLNLQIDSKGNPHMAYRFRPFLGQFGINYTYFNGAAWVTEKNVTSSSMAYHNSGVCLSLSADDTAHIILMQGHPSSDTTVDYRQRTATGWSNATSINTVATIPTNQYQPLCSIRSNNILTAGWVSYFGGKTEIFTNTADVSPDTVKPSLSLLTPANGLVLSSGTQSKITWNASDNVGVSTIDLKYSSDNGATFTSIATGLSNSGSYIWTVPAITGTVKIYATASDVAGNTASATSGGFTVSTLDTAGPVVSITAPVSGASLTGGTQQQIKWTATDASGIKSVALYYSTDNGTTWITEKTGLSNSGSYTWSVPKIATSTAKVKLIVADNSSANNATTSISSPFTIVFVGSPPNAPGNPSPQDLATTQTTNVQLVWQGVHPDGKALTYDIYAGTTASPPLVASALTSASYQLSVKPGTKYYWKVVASDGTLKTSSPVWSFTTASVLFSLIKAPGGLTAVDSTPPGSVLLSWTDNSTNETGFNIERKKGATGTYTKIASVAQNVTTYTDNSVLSGNTEYFYRVVAVSAGSSGSASSAEAVYVTKNNNPTVPSTPSPADGGIDQPTSVTLSWASSDPDGDALTYDIYFGETSPPALLLSDVSTNTTTITNRSPGVTYLWKVIAKDANGGITEGPLWSFTTKQSALPAPTSLVASASSSSVALSWAYPAGSKFFGFLVERKDGATGSYRIVGSSTEKQFTDRNSLTPLTTYSYRVSAYGQMGISLPSPVVNAKMPLPDVTALKATIAKGSVTLSWQNPAFTGFKGVTVVRNQVSAPRNVKDGTPVLTGNVNTFTDSGLQDATTYYYGVFVNDTQGNVSLGSTTSVKTGVVIAGLVSDQNNKGVTGVTVKAFSPAFGIVLQSTTNINGIYILNLLPSKDYIVWVEGKQVGTHYYSTQFANGVVDRASASVLDISTKSAKNINFVVDTATNTSVSGVISDGNTPLALVPVYASANGKRIASTLTDAVGAYTLTVPIRSSYIISAGGTTTIPNGISEYVLTFYQSTSTGTGNASRASVVRVTSTPVSNINISLQPKSLIRGIISDANGALANITVHFNNSRTKKTYSAVTNANGFYSVFVKPSPDYTVSVGGEGTSYPLTFYKVGTTGTNRWADATAVDVSSSDASGIDITLMSGYSVSGKVTLDGAVPAGTYRVSIWSDTKGGFTTTTLDATGGYTFSNLPPATDYRILVAQVGKSGKFYNGTITANTGTAGAGTQDYFSATKLPISTSNITGVDFALVTATAKFTGTVTIPVSSSSTEIWVDAFSESKDAYGFVSITIPAGSTSGSFTINNIESARDYVLSAAPASDTTIAPVFYAGNKDGTVDKVTSNSRRAHRMDPSLITGGIDFTLSAGSSISGTITLPASMTATGSMYFTSGSMFSSTMSSVKVSVSALSQRIEAFIGRIIEFFIGETSKTYSLTGLSSSEDDYQIRVHAKGVASQYYSGDNAGTSDAQTTNREEATLLDPAKVLSGSGTSGGIDVTLSVGNDIGGTITLPAAAAKTYYFYVEAFSANRNANIGVPVTIAKGSTTTAYKLSATPASDYLVSLYSPDFAVAPLSGIDNSAGAVTTADFTLAVSGSISGSVTAGGVGIRKVWVEAEAVGKESVGALTDSSGAYTITGLSAGTYTVTVYPMSSGYAKASLSNVVVTSGATTSAQDFALSAGISISGTVSDSSGLVLTKGWVSALDSAGNSFGTAVQSDGTYKLPGLSAGTAYTVTVRSKGYLEQQATITTLTSGDLGSQNFTMNTGIELAGSVVGATGTTYTPSTDGGMVSIYKDVNGNGSYESSDTFVQIIGISSNGSFSTEPLGAGTYFIVPEVRGFTLATAQSPAVVQTITSAQVSAGNAITGVSVQVQSNASNVISGTVSITTTTGIDHINVMAIDESTGTYENGVKVVSSGGSFTIKDLTAGKTYTLKVYGVDSANVTVGSSTATLTTVSVGTTNASLSLP